MNQSVKWTLAFGAGSALLAAAVLNRIHARDGALDVHADQKIDVQEARVVEAPPIEDMAGNDPRRAAQQHYLSAIVFIQKGYLEKGAAELRVAAQLDPKNDDIAIALKRYGNPDQAQDMADFKAAVGKAAKRKK